MKAKTIRLNDKTADAVERIAGANHTSDSHVIVLAVERLVDEVRETGRLPVPPVDLSDDTASESDPSTDSTPE